MTWDAAIWSVTNGKLMWRASFDIATSTDLSVKGKFKVSKKKNHAYEIVVRKEKAVAGN